jgi:hypothetical protein
MTGQPSPHPWQPPETADASLRQVSPALFRHRQFWLRLAAYRPLLVLGGIWVLLLAIAFVAYSRLLYTGSQTPEPTAVYPHQVPSELRTGTGGEAAPDGDGDDGEDPAAEPSLATPLSGLSGGSLAVMVALCAAGCFVISRQLNASPKPRQRRPKVRAVHPPARRAPKPGPQRLQPYAPATTATPTAPLPTAASESSAPATAMAVDHSPGTIAPAPQVVSPTETTSVDWPQGSLVNAVDMRQQRSLSSFM